MNTISPQWTLAERLEVIDTLSEGLFMAAARRKVDMAGQMTVALLINFVASKPAAFLEANRERILSKTEPNQTLQRTGG